MIKKLIILRYVLFFIILILICANNWFIKNNLYIIFVIFFFVYYIFSLLFIRKIKLKNLETYIKEKHIDDVGEYIYWNNKNLLLSDNYIFVIINDTVTHYKYDQVIKTCSKFHPLSRGSAHYIILYFDDNYKIEVHESHNSLNTNFSDISSFIKQKNPNVEVMH